MEIQSHWSRYLCVLSSGFLEVSIPAILVEYTKKRSHANVYNYISNNLELRNPNMEKITQLAYSFSKKWGEKIIIETEDKTKEAINSIYGNRNLIAHGADTGISYHRILEWYLEAIKLVDKLEDICEKE